MLQEGEIDNRQHTGILSYSLSMNVKKGQPCWEKE